MAVHIPRKQGGRRRGRPSDEELAAVYAEHTTAEVAEMYQVAPRTVANWVAAVRQAEKKALEALGANAEGVDWIRVVKADYLDRMTAILEVFPEAVDRHYIVVNGACPGDPKGKGSAQTAATLEEALKKYDLILRPRSDAGQA